MSSAALDLSLAVPIAMAIAGTAAGFAYFEALRRSAVLLAAGSRLLPLALTAGRIGLAVGLFVAAARLGVGPLLATFGGFFVARIIVVHVVSRSR